MIYSKIYYLILGKAFLELLFLFKYLVLKPLYTRLLINRVYSLKKLFISILIITF